MLIELFNNWLHSDRVTRPKVWSTLFNILKHCDISTYALERIKDDLKFSKL